MVNSEILGALKSALARGHTIEAAKQTMINTGYLKNEIEAAAKSLETGAQPTEEVQQQTTPTISQEPPKIQATQGSSLPERAPQKASAYEVTKQRVVQKQNKQELEKGSKILVITLVIVLALLLGTLIAVFILKDQIISIFSG
jgi:uncharacterized membrane protein